VVDKSATTDTEDNMIDMHDKTVVVTGANSGVGFVTAKRLAEAGAEIVMVCRHRGRGQTARARIAESATGAPPQLFIADLSSQDPNSRRGQRHPLRV
jgi:NAD(P)-dependent dehydrogenase (short-subunit alcohol dehydrogenase family)